MNNNRIINLLKSAKIIDFNYFYNVGKSGRGCYCLFQIVVSKDEVKYVIEAENDFRIIQNDKRLLCWDDLFLDKNYELLYDYDNRLKDFSYTLLSDEINYCKKRLVNKNIKKIIFTPYGDVDIAVGNKIILQFIDNINRHYFSIFRIVKYDEKSNDNGIVLLDIKNKKRGIQLDGNEDDFLLEEETL